MRHLRIFLMAIIVSFYFFPISFTFFPSMNTKMALAVLGIMLFVWHGIQNRKGIVVSTEVFIASFIACIFSLTCFYSVTYNNTTDYVYATYIVSMLVWVGGAYSVCYIISRLHGDISVKLLINYLIGVCVAQCILALLIDNISAVKFFVDSIVITNVERLEKINRLYGIGAFFDVAGIRFSAVLVMIVVLLFQDNTIRLNRNKIAMYVFCFILIAVIGSMIARTTNVGIILSLCYIIYTSGIWKIQIKKTDLKLWSVLISVTVFLVSVCVYLYNREPTVRNLLRFGFEGLINWIEMGEWRTDSTDVLQSMWVFPETLKTWIIGDGYFTDPSNSSGYYMATDVGYLRFIFYCGLIGLSVFSVFFVYLSAACYKRFPQEKSLFLLLLVLVFVIWVKVSTDIFLVYALFICMPMVQKHMNSQQIVKKL